MERFCVLASISPSTYMLMQNLDDITYLHSIRVATLAKEFGTFLQFPNRELNFLMWGSYLHDIGKALIDKQLLKKPTSLTSEEWEIIKQHTNVDNVLLCLPAPLQPVIQVIQCHHERWDGSGYPKGLIGEEIPYLARIVQLLDIYDALIHPRSYKEPYSIELAKACMLDSTAQGWYERSLVEQFMNFLECYCDRINIAVDYKAFANLPQKLIDDGIGVERSPLTRSSLHSRNELFKERFNSCKLSRNSFTSGTCD